MGLIYMSMYLNKCSHFLCWTGAYRYNGEHGVSLCVSEQDVDEGDDLQRFTQAHAVGEDTAKSGATAKPLHRLHQVVVQETDSSDLQRGRKGRGGRGRWLGDIQV